MRCAIHTIAVMLTLMPRGLVQGQVADVTGQWRVSRQPEVGPSKSPAEDWLRALPGATFALTHNALPPLAMVRKDLGYTYFPSLPSITISEGTSATPHVLGFLQAQGRRFEGELVSGGCWIHLSLEESDDGSSLLGSARINTKISTRDCRKSLAKSFKNGEPFPYTLVRLK
jgi:hypothetical protein